MVCGPPLSPEGNFSTTNCPVIAHHGNIFRGLCWGIKEPRGPPHPPPPNPMGGPFLVGQISCFRNLSRGGGGATTPTWKIANTLAGYVK